MLLAEIMVNFYISITALVVLLLFFLVTAICDLVKRRHLLSKGALYYITMLLVPASAFAAVGVPMLFVIGDKPTWAKVLVFLGGIMLFVISAVIYVRGNIFPTDKSNSYGGRAKIIGARRLIVLGGVGTLIYGIFTVTALVDTINLVMIWDGNAENAEELFKSLVFLIIGLLIPMVNLIILIYLIILGSQFLVFAAGVVMTMLQYVLIANGCIRYILTENRSKGEKALYILVALVPGVNIIMGIRYIMQISRILRDDKERSLKQHGENEGRV